MLRYLSRLLPGKPENCRKLSLVESSKLLLVILELYINLVSFYLEHYSRLPY